jgi:predicted O-methyltransferase YrrM
MRALVQRYAPMPLINALRNLRDSGQVAALPQQNFAADNLRTGDTLDLGAIFASSDWQDDWNTDHAAVCNVFGEENLAGGVNPGDRRAIYALIHSLKPQSLLEVGTHIGASMLYIARALKHGGGRITTVDICDVNDPYTGAWRSSELPDSPKQMAEQLGCGDRVTFIAQASTDYLKETTDTFDFIFLDGDHSARAVYEEVAAALPRLREGGVILLHDYYPKGRPLFPDGNIIYGPFRAIDRIVKENPQINALPLGDLPWPTKQGSHKTSLALLTRKA